MKKISDFLYFIVCLIFFSIINFYFSNSIIDNINTGYELQNSVFRLTYVENTGAAFSILQDSTMLLIVLSLIALVGIFAYVIIHLGRMKMKSLFAVAVLSAGVFGNLYERISFGFVRDYFEIVPFEFPVFNVSDIFINVGVVLLVLIILLKKSKL